MFNLIDTESGGKVDFWLLVDEPFDRSRFARRHQQEVLGIRLVLSTPEDTILQKLKWAKLSGEREGVRGCAQGVREVQAGILDLEYLELWVGRLGRERLVEAAAEGGGGGKMNRIARQFGGGGRVKASGARVPGAPREVAARVVEAVRRLLVADESRHI